MEDFKNIYSELRKFSKELYRELVEFVVVNYVTEVLNKKDLIFLKDFPKIKFTKKRRNVYDLLKNTIYISKEIVSECFRNKEEKKCKELKYILTEELFHHLLVVLNPSIKNFLLSKEVSEDEKAAIILKIEEITKFLIYSFYLNKKDENILKYIKENSYYRSSFDEKKEAYDRYFRFLIENDFY